MMGLFFFSFFFLQLWRLGFPPPQLLLDGGVACVMATCHAGIGWRVLGSSETFQFPTFFETLPFLNPLCFFCAYFFEISMFIAPSPLASSVLHCCDFCAHPFDSSISLSFVGTSLCLSCSFHLKFCLLPFSVLGSLFWTLLFLFPFWWTILILGALPPKLPSFSLI